jgi:hypothetical protein
LKEEKQKMLDKSALQLFKHGCSVETGMPAWAVKEYMFRKSYPLTPSDILGLSPDYMGCSMLDEYENMCGYNFSWGQLHEEVVLHEEVEESVLIGRFEFVPTAILQAFPQSALLEDLFMFMYRHHPLFDPEFDCDESSGDWPVIAFEAFGEAEIEALRRWIAKVFLPGIWDDLMAEAMVIVETAKAAAIAASPDGSYEEVFVERGRFQLCGDPADLSFHVPRS